MIFGKIKKNHQNNPISLKSKIRKLIILFAIPMAGILIMTFSLLYSYSTSYTEVLHNVTTASEFNQDFKEDIDLKTYYYVVDSHYSEGLPINDVKAAQKLAQDLLDTTDKKESWKAINGVLNLCINLESKMYQIEATDNYEERKLQLENNIYVLTELIQEYMYNYLYHEAALLDELQASMSKRLYIEMSMMVILGICVFGFLIKWLSLFAKSITIPVGKLCTRVQAIGDGDLKIQKPIEAEEYEIQMLSDGFEKMVERLNQLIEQNKQEQISLRKAELALLQAQINPHFLYNTLDTIIWLIEMEQYEKAVEMVTSLSGFFRSSLSKGRDIIEIREEEKHVRSYLEIQQVRYRDILDYEIDIDSQLANYQIPKLTLQPLVENALYHGIKLKRGKGTIHVKGYMKGNDIFIEVVDSGAGMDSTRLKEVQRAIRKEERIGFGLSTVHERLQLLFGTEYGLALDSKEGEGTRVVARIPKQMDTKKGAQDS